MALPLGARDICHSLINWVRRAEWSRVGQWPHRESHGPEEGPVWGSYSCESRILLGLCMVIRFYPTHSCHLTSHGLKL